MAFKAKDGSMHSMASRMNAKNNSMAAKDRRGSSALEPPDAQGAPEEMGDMDSQDGEQVAAEHGPAQEVHITHAEGHHVHSVHPDGHEHHSEHGSVEEAHEHGKKLAGAGQESEPESEPMEGSEEGY